MKTMLKISLIITLILIMPILSGQVARSTVLADANVSILTQEQKNKLIQMKKTNPSTVFPEPFQMWPCSETGEENPQESIISSEESPLDVPDSDYLELPSYWPNDVLVADQINQESVSMDVDYNDDIYVVTGHTYYKAETRGTIYKSTNNGQSWFLWHTFYIANDHVLTPAICVTANNIVVIFKSFSPANMWAFWRRKNGSNSGFTCIHPLAGANPSIDNLRPTDDHSLCVTFRGTIGDIFFTFSNDEGQTWSTPETVTNSGTSIKWDGAITVAQKGASVYALISYYEWNNKYVDVRRSTSSGWDLVYQLGNTTGPDRRYPAIKALQYGSESAILVYHERETASPGDKNLAFAYSTSTGDPGTWNSYYWDDPSFNQVEPQLAVGSFGHDYFYVGFWNWHNDNVPRVWTVYHNKNNLSSGNFKIASRNASLSGIYYKTAINWTIQDIIPLVAWVDGRSGRDIYCNTGDLGIEETSSCTQKQLSLLQNYPNPVFSRTVIKYAIPEKSKVELKIYGAAGREIASLVNKEQVAGHYKAQWDVSNVSKKTFPNGVYFYQLKTGNFTDTKKMVIVR